MKLRKIFAAVMACSIVCGAPAVIGAYQPSYELMANAADIVDSGYCGADMFNLTWEFDSEGTLTISGEGDMWDYSDSYYVPWRQYREKINKIVIDEQVTRIGDYAFYCCENASIVKLPDGVKSIGEKSFGLSGIEEIVIPNGVAEIPKEAFDACHKLKSVTIPNSVTSIGYMAFEYCDNLESLTIPNSVTNIDSYAFRGCTKLKSVTIPNSITNIGDYGVFSTCSSLKTVTIPNSVTSIGCQVFVYCSNLESIIIPDSVASIDYVAFAYCDGLKSITILNPECEIYDAANTICSTFVNDSSGSFEGVIIGYKGSTAEAYAEKYGYEFKEIGSETTATTTITTTKQTTTTSTTTTTTSGKATTTTAETTTTTAAPTTTEGTTTTTDTTTTATTAASTSSTAQPSTTSTAASTTAQPTTTTTTSSSALDSRFVGKWELYKYEVDGAYTSLKPDGFELFANGEGTWSSGGRILWTVVDEFLYIEANDGNLPININRYKYINGELLWSGWTQVVDNIAPETEKYAMNFYGKSENIYFRRVEDSEQTTTATTTTTTTSTTAQETTTTATAPVNEVSLGDPTGDGKIDAKDATFVLVEYAKLSTGGESELSDAEKSAADVNKDGKADAKDASAILSYYAYVSTGGTDTIQKFLKTE